MGKGEHSGPGGCGIIVILIGATFSFALGVAYVWVYFSPRAADVCSREYADRIEAAPDQKPGTFRSPFFWIPLVAAGVFLLLAIVGALAGGDRPR